MNMNYFSILWPPLLGNGSTNDLAIFIDIDYPGRAFGLTLPIVCIASRKRLDEGPVVMLVTGRDVEELQSITKTYSKFIKVFYVTDSNETTEPDKGNSVEMKQAFIISFLK